MEKNNKIDIDDNINASTELSYETPQEKEICLGKATENQTNIRPPHASLTDNTTDQYVSEKHPTSTSPQGSTAYNDENAFINIQLLYDPNAPTDPEI